MSSVLLLRAFVLWAISLAALALFGGALFARFGLPGLMASELFCVLLPTLYGMWALRGAVQLPLLGAPVRTFIGAILFAFVACYVVSLFGDLIVEKFLPTPESIERGTADLIAPPNGLRPLAYDLLVFAVTPAVCEELLFRHLLFGMLAKWRGNLLAIVLTGVWFGLFHFSPYKLIPATLLGFCLGLVRARAGTVLPAMLFHLTNNFLVVILLRHRLQNPPLPNEPHGLVWLVAVAITSIPAWLALRERQA